MRRMIFLGLIGGLGVLALVWLGVWQLQRLAWKEAILANIDARIAVEPVALPAQPDPVADKYLPVRVSGQFDGGEVHVLTSIQGIGPGFRIIARFVTEDGRAIMVDRGFVQDAAKDNPRRLGPATLVGNLHWPVEVDSFTPAPDVAGNYWYARDVVPMAEALNTEPLLVVLRDRPEGDQSTLILPVSTKTVANDHLQYAITWFSLALIWAVMTAYFLMRTRAKPNELKS